ncbi:MAG: hypothetical protein QM632_01355 [Micrococcaceae bacterium]
MDYELQSYKKDRDDALMAAMPNTLTLIIVPMMAWSVLMSLVSGRVFSFWLIITVALLYLNYMQIKRMGGWNAFWSATKSQWENVKDQQRYYKLAKQKAKGQSMPAPRLNKQQKTKTTPTEQKTNLTDNDVENTIVDIEKFIEKK